MGTLSLGEQRTAGAEAVINPARVHSSDRLRGDCAACIGLCCTLPRFAASTDFGHAKPAGVRCHHLADQHGCQIHSQLAAVGYRGCVAYDCFGAGQRVMARHQGVDRPTPSIRREYEVASLLHEALWYLRAALGLELETTVRDQVRVAFGRVDAAVESGLTLDAARTLREEAAVLLHAVSRAIRGDRGADHAFAVLTGADLRTVDLRWASLRGATLCGADLRGVDLSGADVTGADLRGADLRGADLRRTLFLTPGQLAVARTDGSTRQ